MTLVASLLLLSPDGTTDFICLGGLLPSFFLPGFMWLDCLFSWPDQLPALAYLHAYLALVREDFTGADELIQHCQLLESGFN